ncbi:MAG TPA: hypothetical protein PLG17_05030 [Thermodesulfobacteriota bacterium]|nr:hypothetical protein [Deltaproteobacteria bacterium]HNR12431.1 hypothetical protein [Thermodesulfobacteriota bacterium]HNU70459.1 hypothetical protein [Thermodesulfobacteriota bacterium]HOC38766.1 hypothetical protein [Thermodesulfobacteriota bacterium]HQO77859.1 hypothetical protein [Thermodesulfobacteriota bacterium]
MKRVYCTYHPTVPAQWECPDCNLQFCDRCVMKSDVISYGLKKTHHLCPKCRSYAQSLTVANVIEPFWEKLPQIFAYPLQFQDFPAPYHLYPGRILHGSFVSPHGVCSSPVPRQSGMGG